MSKLKVTLEGDPLNEALINDVKEAIGKHGYTVKKEYRAKNDGPWKEDAEIKTLNIIIEASSQESNSA